VAGELPSAPAIRLTSKALRTLESPPWRVVYEISQERMDGVEHVLIGPGGIFALVTSMDPMPHGRRRRSHAVAATAAIARRARRRAGQCAMTSDRLVTVHWERTSAAPLSIEVMPGVTAVDGRRLRDWADAAAGRDGPPHPAQVDLDPGRRDGDQPPRPTRVADRERPAPMCASCSASTVALPQT
jgi:hypothetical protein